MKNPPYYLVIFNNIVHEIYTGQISVGDSLDSTKTLCERYVASQNTINTVMKKLTKNGFIATQKGKPATVISNCGNQRQALEQLCDRFYEVIAIYEVFHLLFPSMAVYSIKNFNETDIIELKGIIDKMDSNKNNVFSFREQKSLFINKLVSKSNSLIKEICRRAEETIMIPSMASNVLEELHSPLALMNAKYAKNAKKIYKYIENYNFEQIKQELSQLYKQIKEDITSMIIHVAQNRGYSLPQKEETSFKNFYLYDFIISDIVDEIYTGNYKIGDFLPSIEFMCKKYEVSMPTVRSAYKILNELQIAKTINGKGTKITLFSECSNNFYYSLEGVLSLTKFWEALQFISIIIQDVAVYAAQKMNYKDAEEIENKLRQLWQKNSSETIYPAFILLNEIFKNTKLDVLNEIYIALKKSLIGGLYLNTFFTDVLHNLQEEKYFRCLEALEELKKGNAEKFAEILAEIFAENLSQVQAVILKFGWTVQ